MKEIDVSKYTEFDWDKGNLDKNRLKHGITKEECEEVFFNEPQIISPDHKHSHTEMRYSLLGQTNEGTWLNIIFTLRYEKIRIISARKQSKKERMIYKKERE
jgi:hypothetical protein